MKTYITTYKNEILKEGLLMKQCDEDLEHWYIDDDKINIWFNKSHVDGWKSLGWIKEVQQPTWTDATKEELIERLKKCETHNRELKRKLKNLISFLPYPKIEWMYENTEDSQNLKMAVVEARKLISK